jgi:BNR/Asp-box repeat
VPSVGDFRSGRGDFYDQEEFDGKYILVRFSIWKISANSAQSEQAFSEDGGKTWEVNWVNKYTRASDQTEIDWTTQDTNLAPKGAQDFDFNFGKWRTHIQRVLDPFSEEQHSIEIDGTLSVRKVWGGRAGLEEIEADGPKGHWEALTLFLYNPKSRQWSQTFISAKTGVISAALIGAFKDGLGELFQQDTFNDRSILVRGAWSNIKSNTHNYTESYSADGGKTWKPAFIAYLTREQE